MRYMLLKQAKIDTHYIYVYIYYISIRYKMLLKQAKIDI